MTTAKLREDYGTVTPFLMVPDVEKVMAFAKRAFGAEEVSRLENPKGGIMHAEIKIGDSVVMLGDTMGKSKGTNSMLYLYVDDVDKTHKQAVAAGGKSVAEPEDQFYGDRASAVEDGNGTQWWIATHIEDVAPDELEKRAKQWSAETANAK